MVTRGQVRKLMKERGRGRNLETAATCAGMCEKTARRYVDGATPGGLAPRTYRTRTDPFESVWGEVSALLKESPGFEAQTIFELLRSRPELSFSDGQLRTFQRGVHRLRPQLIEGREVMFAQEHRAGEYAQSDFTDMNSLSITIAGEAFPHLFYHFVLPYSNWETGQIAFSETFEALIGGFQSAVWELGRVPKYHRTDNLSAATHDLKDGGRVFNQRYLGVLDHYSVLPDKNSPGRGHENGDVEQSHYRFDRAVEQALLVRGGRDFSDRSRYEAFLRSIRDGRNRHRQAKLGEELGVMRELPLTRLEDFRKERVLVRYGSTIRVAGNLYSVPSRLIGEEVDVRLHSERIEVYFAGERVQEMERLRGKGGAAINYRHIARSLARKPGAFARYRYREALFPTVVFRQAFDELEAQCGGRADVEYVRILHLAATENESEVEEILVRLMKEKNLRNFKQVEACVRPERNEPPFCDIGPPNLLAYDECLELAGGVR